MEQVTDWRNWLLEQIESELLSRDSVIMAFVKWNTAGDIEEMLDANEMHPRYWEDEEDAVS